VSFANKPKKTIANAIKQKHKQNQNTVAQPQTALIHSHAFSSEMTAMCKLVHNTDAFLRVRIARKSRDNWKYDD